MHREGDLMAQAERDVQAAERALRRWDAPRRGPKLRPAHLTTAVIRQQATLERWWSANLARIGDAGGDVALVKCGDVMDNLGRLAAVTDEALRARLTAKYTSALARLAPVHDGSPLVAFGFSRLNAHGQFRQSQQTRED